MSDSDKEPFLRRPDIPLYQSVADRLRDDIAAGHYAVGANLPTVPELAERFGVSKYTISGALAQLKDAGIISIRRRGGTRVEGMLFEASEALFKAFSVTAAYSRDFRLRVQHKDMIVARRETATLLQCPPGRTWWHFTGVREGGEPAQPAGFAEVFIDAAYPKVYERVNRNTTFIYPLFVELYKESVIEIRQEIRAIAIEGKAAEALGLPEGTQGIRYISRFFNAKGIRLEVAVNIHPLDRIAGTERLIFPR